MKKLKQFLKWVLKNIKKLNSIHFYEPHQMIHHEWINQEDFIKNQKEQYLNNQQNRSNLR